MSSSGSPKRRLTSHRLALLGVAVLVGTLGGGCASTGAVPRPFPVPGGSTESAGTRPISGSALASAALAFQGVPYRAAGADPSGFDCSGLVQYVFAQHGVAAPRSVVEQFRAGRPVGPERVEPGDLVFFKIDAREVSHVGIAVGDGRFVHAPSTRGTVRVEALDSPYWARRYAGARRVGIE
jgi:cell wall-associated NlpC family hydrolase